MDCQKTAFKQEGVVIMATKDKNQMMSSMMFLVDFLASIFKEVEMLGMSAKSLYEVMKSKHVREDMAKSIVWRIVVENIGGSSPIRINIRDFSFGNFLKEKNNLLIQE